MAVKIVTDSTADLPPDLVQELGITVVPLNVHFGEETFLDGVDMDADRFFERLVSESRLPTTSQPSPAAFMDTYSGLLEAGHQVVSVHISAKLSGTMNSALQAQQQLAAGDRLVVVDSLHAGLALGIVAVAGAQAARDGASHEETVEAVHRSMSHLSVFFLVETLEYLQKGGRIGKAQAFLGSLLHVRPILTIRDGEVHPLERQRTRKRGIERLLQLAAEQGPFQRLAACHSTTPEETLALIEQATPLLADGGTVIQTRFGSVIGTHIGPGAIGIAVQSEKTE